MKSSLIKLQKYFKLEADRGYDNRAILGGFERLLDRWEAEARLEAVPEEIIQVVIQRLHDYDRLSQSSRAEVLEGLVRRIQRATDENSTQEPEELEPFVSSPPTAAEPLPPDEETPSTELPDFPQEQSEQPPEATELTTPDQDEDLQPETVPDEAPSHKPQLPGRSKPPDSGPLAALNAPVTVLQGVGAKNAQTLARLGIHSLRDMLYYLPRRYNDYSRMKPINRLWYGEELTVIGTLRNLATRRIRSGKLQITEGIIHDGTGALRITWFNQPWIVKRLREGQQYVVSGKVEQYLGRLVMNTPEVEQLDQQQLSTNRIVPVYPLAGQITQRWLRRLMNSVVTYWAPRVSDPIPETVLDSAGLVDLSTALLQVHYPDSWDELKAARHRLAFDEIFLLQLGVMRQKRTWKENTARKFEADPDWLQAQIARLPYQLTGAQTHALEDIRHDLASGHPMNRLLQGDVGSGKTAIAALAMAMVTHTGAQAALMAPTSILAEQHFKSLQMMLSGALLMTGDVTPSQPAGEESISTTLLQPEEIRLMVGATSESEKAEVRAGLADGSIKIVVGTHALIEDPVNFADLQLAIVDEQHRFGVEQRSALRSKGQNPHLLVMTATPIPRSLALTVYGDLDLTVMDEMPPGRQSVGTHVLPPREIERAYSLIRSQVEQGHQAFIIYPLVEESDKSEAKAAVEEHQRLQEEIFPRLRVGLLHGRMKPEEKDVVMAQFRDGKFHILVSTSVIEVGVDVPNATVMLIEGANRFGLSQLHQFRGRVGRGSAKAFCLLIPENADAVENERLQAMAETNDGFVLAERDLEQRGPGQFLGTRQSGFSELQFANLTDVRLIEKARQQSIALFERDPNLDNAEHTLLAESLERFWSGGKGDIS